MFQALGRWFVGAHFGAAVRALPVGSVWPGAIEGALSSGIVPTGVSEYTLGRRFVVSDAERRLSVPLSGFAPAGVSEYTLGPGFTVPLSGFVPASVSEYTLGLGVRGSGARMCALPRSRVAAGRLGLPPGRVSIGLRSALRALAYLFWDAVLLSGRWGASGDAGPAPPPSVSIRVAAAAR